MLAAGAGERLRPLTWHRPKVLCPVNGVALLDLNLARVRAVTGSVAVNVHHHRTQLERHLATRHPEIHVSVEEREALGTGGALGTLREWIAGRPALVVNGDAWSDVGVGRLVDGWDGNRVRLLVPLPPSESTPPAFGPGTPLAGALMPWGDLALLPRTPAGLYREVLLPAADAGRLEVVGATGRFADCGTPAAYLAANLAASGGAAVVGEGARVEGEVIRSVVWSGAAVGRRERLIQAVRTDTEVTVLVR